MLEGITLFEIHLKMFRDIGRKWDLLVVKGNCIVVTR